MASNKYNTSNNRLVVPEAQEAMNKFKMEAANEVGVNLKQGYNGDLTSREAGSVGGQMVKKMIDGEAGKGFLSRLLLLLCEGQCPLGSKSTDSAPASTSGPTRPTPGVPFVSRRKEPKACRGCAPGPP